MLEKHLTKQSHYLPRQSYLDYFTDKTDKIPFIWVYSDKENIYKNIDAVKPKKINPLKLCKEGYLYESSLFEVNAIENTLASIEGEYKQVLDNKILIDQPITNEEKKTVSSFISTLELRTPSGGKAKIENYCDDVLDKIKELETQFNNGKSSPLHQEILAYKQQNMGFAQVVATSIELNRWQFSDILFLSPQIEGEYQFFITSDNPASLIDFTNMNQVYGIDPLSVTAELVVPLTSKIAAFVNNAGFNGYMSVSPNFVREINSRTLRWGNRYVLSPKHLNKTFIENCTARFQQSLLLLALENKLNKEWENRHSK